MSDTFHQDINDKNVKKGSEVIFSGKPLVIKPG